MNDGNTYTLFDPHEKVLATLVLLCNITTFIYYNVSNININLRIIVHNV